VTEIIKGTFFFVTQRN